MGPYGITECYQGLQIGLYWMFGPWMTYLSREFAGWRLMKGFEVIAFGPNCDHGQSDVVNCV